MKLNKQKMEEMRQRMKNIKNKMLADNKERVPKKYYVLLMLMLMLGMITLTNNIKRYKEVSKEDYIGYDLEDEAVDSNDIEVVNYTIDQSSISTDISNMDNAIATLSPSGNNEKSTKETKYIMPVEGEILKEYATEKLVYSETLGMWKTHPGIDIKANLNDDVKSASNGIVQLVEKDAFYGNVVKITDEEGYIFVYSNLDSNIPVKQGEKVKQGCVIGTVGVSAAGELEDTAHIHFEVIKEGMQVNPLDLIN